MTENQKQILNKLNELGRPASSAELHNGSKHHVSTTRNAIIGLEAEKLISRVGRGRGTKYAIRKPQRRLSAVPVKRADGTEAFKIRPAEPKKRWVLLIDGEALIVEAVQVAAYPERRP